MLFPIIQNTIRIDEYSSFWSQMSECLVPLWSPFCKYMYSQTDSSDCSPKTLLEWKDVQIYSFPNSVRSFITNATVWRSGANTYTGSVAMNYQDDCLHQNTFPAFSVFWWSISDCSPASRVPWCEESGGFSAELPRSYIIPANN